MIAQSARRTGPAGSGRSVHLAAAVALQGAASAAVVLGGAVPVYGQVPAPYAALTDARPYRSLPASAAAISPSLADSGTVQLDLPFAFTYFGAEYRTLYVNANGFVSLVTSRNGFNFAPQTNPSGDAPDGYIAALWDDWCAGPGNCAQGANPGSGVFYEIDAAQGVARIEWRRVKHFRDDRISSDVTFQIALFRGPTGRIELSYGDVIPGRDAINFPTEIRPRIGLESPDGARGSWLPPCDGATPCSTNEATQVTGTRITVLADLGPDLSVSDVTTPERARPGLPFTAQARLFNYHRDAVGPFTFSAFLLEAGRTSTVGATPAATSAPLTLGGFVEEPASFNVEVPDATPEGDYRLAVVVDAGDRVSEVDEANNAVFGPTLTIAGRGPDFVAGDVRALAGQVAVGDQFDVAYRLENAGNEAGRLTAQVYLSTNPLISTADRVLASPAAVIAASRQVVTATVTVSAEPELPTGRYYLGLIADPALAVDELDEFNNVARAPTPVVLVSSELAVVTEALPVASVGRPYAAQLAAAGGDGRYRFEATGLPDGLTLAGAAISGVPATAGAANVDVRVTSAGRAATASLTLLVDDATLPLTPVGGPLPEGFVGQDYQAPLLAVGGAPPYRWRLVSGRLPSVLTLAPDGALQGVLTSAGAFPIEVEVEDGAGASERVAATLTVRAPANLTIVGDATLPPAALNAPYSQSLGAAGGVEPRSWSAETVLPPGLTVTTQGEVAGIPERVGRYRFRVRVQDAVGNSDLNTFAVEVRADGRFAVSPDRLPPAEPDRLYVAALRASGGRRPLTWTLDGALPEGLIFGEPDPDDPAQVEADAVIRGASSEIGVWPLTVTVTDARGRIAERPYALWIRTPPAPDASDEGCRCAGRRAGTPAWWALAPMLIVGLQQGARRRRR